MSRVEQICKLAGSCRVQDMCRCVQVAEAMSRHELVNSIYKSSCFFHTHYEQQSSGHTTFPANEGRRRQIHTEAHTVMQVVV